MTQLDGYGERAIRELSGGQQQRVALARAMVIQPDILLMDEPLGALDRQLRKEVQFEIRRLHAARPRTTIYVTHDQEEALVMSDRIAVMRAGRIVQIGSGADLYERPVDTFVARFLGESNLIAGTVGALADGRATLAVPGLAQPLEGRAGRRPSCRGARVGAAAAGGGPGPRRRPAGARCRARLSWGTRRRAAHARQRPRALVSPSRQRVERARRRCSRAGMRARSRFCRMRLSSPNQEEAMLKKRRMLLSLGAAGLVTGPLTLATGLRPARAQGRPLTFCSWGGALTELEKTTMLDPFAE